MFPGSTSLHLGSGQCLNEANSAMPCVLYRETYLPVQSGVQPLDLRMAFLGAFSRTMTQYICISPSVMHLAEQATIRLARLSLGPSSL